MVEALIIFSMLLQELIVGITTSPSNIPVFTHVQGCGIATTTQTATTLTCVMASNPAQGNAVLCGAGSSSTSITATAADLATSPNAYTLSSNTPFTDTGQSNLWLFYLLNSPSTANASIKITFSGHVGPFAYFACDEFHRSGGAWSVDLGATGTSGTSSAATITTPTISISGARDVLYGVAFTGSHMTGVGGSWSQNAQGLLNTGCSGGSCYLAEYQVVTANTPVSYTLFGSGQSFGSTGISFK